MVSPAYNWSGFYVGAYGGSGYNGSGDISVDPGTPAGNPGFGAAANGGLPFFTGAYNNLANGGIGGIPNTINPAGLSCFGLTGACAGAGPGAPTLNVTANNNPGYRTDSTIPASLTAASQMQALYGVELGYRRQFDRFVLGIGADITGFTKGGATNVNSTGSFYNSNGATGNATAIGCIGGVLGNVNTCQTAQALSTSGSVITVNTGGSALNLAIKTAPNWVGTVRGSAGYAFDRVLLNVSGGLAYSDAPLSVLGNYRDTSTSACSGVSNSYVANTNIDNGGSAGNSSVSYSCNGNPLNSTSVNRVITSNVNFSGNRGGGLLTGFAVGTGAAYAISDNISISVESLYYNLGTARTTVTGTGTQTTTTNTTAIGPAPGGGATTTTTTTAALTSTPFTVSRQIDGYITKAGVQLKF